MISFDEGGVKIAETLRTNAIVWIHSLDELEMGPTNRILEDIEDLRRAGGLPVFIYGVTSQAELFGVLSEVEEQARQGLRPVLHLDAHGSPTSGLALRSGEFVPWHGLLTALGRVNTAAENNLVCIFALCFGLRLYEYLHLSQPVPAYFFAAPELEIHVGFLERQTATFYRRLHESGNVTTAFNETLGKEMQFFHCQGLLLQVLSRFFRVDCAGKQRARRQERLTTIFLRRAGIEHPDAGQLRHARAEAKAFSRPGQHVIDRFAGAFLIGRRAAFSYEQMQMMRERARASRSS